jgi:hypothetical protein
MFWGLLVRCLDGERGFEGGILYPNSPNPKVIAPYGDLGKGSWKTVENCTTWAGGANIQFTECVVLPLPLLLVLLRLVPPLPRRL